MIPPNIYVTLGNVNAQSVSLEHIDPIRHTLICGMRNDLNEILASLSYNARKTNRFVPYRVCDHPAPVTFGDVCEFLIEDEWVVCEFGGDIWWAESNRVGNATNTRRCGLRTWSEEDMVLRREILKKAREARNLSDNHFSEMGKKCKGKGLVSPVCRRKEDNQKIENTVARTLD